MKWIFSLSLVLFSQYSFSGSFEVEAKLLASDLKKSLMKNLSEEISKNGAVKAIPFCHENVRPIAKEAAGERLAKYEFGRTSHKLRNKSNEPQVWLNSYLKEFEGTFKGDVKKDYIVHQFETGKKAYLEPLFVQAQCLTCHGEILTKDVKNKLKDIYPEDKATGFKLNEFRGFIWIKEK